MSMTWHKRYHMDALDGMRSLTLEQRGAYTTILDLIYLRGGSVPDDAMFISGWMGVFPKTWNRIRKALIGAGKLIAEGGLLTNPRATKEVVLSKARSVENKTNGRFGGLASKKNNDLPEANARQTKTQNETPEGKKIESQSSSQDAFKENVICFESALRSPPSAGESGLKPGQEERPIQRASDFATDDGNVIITHEQFTEWEEKYPAVSNKRGRLRHAARSWLDEREQSKFEERFESYLGNEQRKAAAKLPKQTASEKRAAEQVLRDRKQRSAAAAEFQSRQDEKIRQRRAAAQK